MVNTNIQGSIPIAGRGFVARRNGDFAPGEYKRLTNIEILDERLVNRRNIHSAAGDVENAVVIPHINSFGFIGNMREFSVSANATEQLAFNGSEQTVMWAPTLIATPAGAGSFVKLIGFFRYNNKNHWLVMEYQDLIEVRFVLYDGPVSTTADVPSTYNAAYFATLTRTVLLTFAAANPDFSRVSFRNFFMQQDRLWIVTSVGAYFSKATDPRVFAVPDGGFFKFPDQNINYAMGLRNSVYVLCDNQINVITYTADPNEDAYVRTMSDNMGGDHGCIFQDTPVVINQRGIFSLSGNSVDKINDNEFDVGDDYYSNTINAFEDYLVVQRYRPVNYEKFTPTPDSSVRTNLIPNPSLTTNLNHFDPTTLYVTRTRDGGDYYPGASGTFSHKCVKTNDKTVANRTNLVPNPNFLTNLTTWTATESSIPVDFVTGWTRVADNGGSASCRINMTGTGSTNAAGSATLTSNNIPVVAGQQYFLSAYAKYALGTDAQIDPGLDMTLEFFNGGGGSLGVTQAIIATTTGYVRYSVNAVAPVGAVNAKVIFQAVGNAVGFPTFTRGDRTFFVDQVQLEASSAVTSFFDGATADTAEFDYAWSGTANASLSLEKGDEGPTSVELVEWIDFIPATALTGYTLGFAYRFTAGASFTADLEITQYDGVDALLNTSIIPITITRGSWQYVTSNFTAVDGTVKIKFKISVPIANFPFADSAWFDAFHLEKTDTFSGYFDGDTTDTAALNYAWSGTANDSTSTATVLAFIRKEFANGKEFTPFQKGNSLGYNMFFLNMVNGAAHVVHFQDSFRENPGDSSSGYITDVIVNTNKDTSGNYNIFFMTSHLTSETPNSLTYHSFMYYMNSFRETDFFEYAVIEHLGNTLRRVDPQIEIEIDSYVPDGSEYQMKKFRNLELMAKTPLRDLYLSFGFYNKNFQSGLSLKDLSSDYAGDNLGRPHYPYRVGVNQRARSLSLKIYNDSFASWGLGEFGLLEISDIRVLWTYTGRGPTVRVPDSSGVN